MAISLGWQIRATCRRAILRCSAWTRRPDRLRCGRARPARMKTVPSTAC